MPRISDLVNLRQDVEILFLTIFRMMMVLLVPNHTLRYPALISHYFPGSQLTRVS